tara:strand:- start:115602 stop:116387 length:786 start_codon:yes stop_codon:yes gene_type:complete
MIQSSIKIHEDQDFASMRIAGRLAADTLDYITPFILPGVTTEELNTICHDFVSSKGGTNAPLGYRGYPKSICTSINHVVCHGIPGDRILKEGDVLNIDVTPVVNGWHGDSSRMYYVGNVSTKAKRLINITYDSMMRGIDTIRPGATLGDLGYAIQTYAENNRCSVVRDFCGHGTGQVFHSPPNILHYGQPGEGITLKSGMIFTIEPMLNLGSWEVKLLKDGWTAVTKDKSLSAQFEHTIGVTDNGYEIFTLSSKGYTKPPY